MDQQDIFSMKEAVFLGFGAIGAGIYSLLKWIMPKTYEIFAAHIKRSMTQEINDRLDALSAKFANYQADKHKMEGELAECKDAIVNQDKEKLKILREHYENE